MAAQESGRPRDTPEQCTLLRLQREERHRKLKQTTQGLHEHAAFLAEDGPRRTNRVQSQLYNTEHIGTGRKPCYTFVLFGEEGWDADDDYGYQIVVNWYDLCSAN